VVRLRLPPLRERREDMPQLAARFMAGAAKRLLGAAQALRPPRWSAAGARLAGQRARTGKRLLAAGRAGAVVATRARGAARIDP
jgi:hypothetical protein